MVQSGLPDSLSSTHLFIYSSCLAIIDHKNATKNAAGHNRDPRIPSPRHNITHIFLSFLQSSKCTRAHFLPIDARGFSILGATIHYTSFLSCNHQNATKCSGAKFLSIKAQGFCILSTTPFYCNLHFFIVDESSECIKLIFNGGLSDKLTN